MTNDLSRLGATALSRLIAAREVSVREVVEATLARIAASNPAHNAIISARPDPELLAEADAADHAIAAGQPLGSLHGLPIAIKDLAATRGLRMTLGSPLFANTMPDTDALQVARIRAAGAIIIGKTNTPEFGLGSHTFNPVFGATRNAFDPSRSAGGSSGGAAVALALSMIPIADGSDFGGSLRNPAGWNNVFGFRPSQGRVPSHPSEDAFLGQLSTDGPMARHVEDVALLLSAQAGFDRRAPLSLPDAGFRFEQHLDEGRPARIAWLGDLGGHLPMEAGVLDLCRTALGTFETLGHHVESLVPDVDFDALWRCFVTLRHFSVGGHLLEFYRDPDRRALLKPEAQWEVEGFLGLTAPDIRAAALMRTTFYQKALALFDEFDALALPSAQLFPFPVDWRWPESIAGRPMESYHRWMEVVVPGTLLGCPVICVPAGFGPGPEGRLPMGLQLIGRPRDDLAVLQLAHAYERASPWIAAARA